MEDQDQTNPIKPDRDQKNGMEPDPGEPDFYFENGFMVFTRSYHLKRGYCCGSGCRHCPFGEKLTVDS
jgi:hypothetical protein